MSGMSLSLEAGLYMDSSGSRGKGGSKELKQRVQYGFGMRNVIREKGVSSECWAVVVRFWEEQWNTKGERCQGRIW